MPIGTREEDDEREIKFKQFIKKVGSAEYWSAVNYYCDLSSAKKLFSADVLEDRITQLRIEENKLNNKVL